MELLNVVKAPWQNVVSMMSLRHQCDAIVALMIIIYDAICIGACQTEYAMLHQYFNDIRNCFVFFKHKLQFFSQTNIFSSVS